MAETKIASPAGRKTPRERAGAELDAARADLIRAARDLDYVGLTEAHHCVMGAVSAVDDALEALVGGRS